MKRVSEKVKDIVEVCAFSQIYDFAADPETTVEAYRFTDITAGLMAKWIDSLAGVRPGSGQSLALAGLRGVGKSHFLSYIAAVVGQPDLRAKIADSHVQASVEQLSRRSGKVIVVRRGLGPSLTVELRQAVADTLARPLSELSDSVNELLLTVFERGGETPVILFDTAPGREQRVARDDGPVLSIVAEAARSMGLFVGVALDDDISGADGANSSLVSNFSIDYLDQEHLYKIVDNHIFAKRLKKLPLLHEIYEEYRSEIPGFRWSEQRFAALYPLHPEALEIAPLIRLYIQDFALLGFAAESGIKILSRPANSLIGLDEMFDSVEPRLRASAELREAFAAYDGLEREVIAKGPVKQRHIAKLALKGLFMLSLNGQGATAADVAAAMMILPADEAAAGGIEPILRAFVDAMPESVNSADGADGNPKYLLKLGDKEDLRAALVELAPTIDDDAVWQVLLRQTAERFSDLEASDDFGEVPTACALEWRGAIRRGEVVWKIAGDAAPLSVTDWRIVVVRGQEDNAADRLKQQFVWRTAAPTAEEAAQLRRYHLLQTNVELREKFAASWPTALQTHSIAVEKIWNRLFLDDAILVTPESEKRFAGEDRSAYSLSHLLSLMLADSFDAAFPEHPAFRRILDDRQVSLLVGGFFGGSDLAGDDVQKAAADLAAPLGLAEAGDTGFVPAPLERLLVHDMLQPLLAAAAGRGTDILSVADAGERLRMAPFGLTREAQQLLLAALVAQRQFDFVTVSRDRINHRSLDLQIIWDDIVGIALPQEQPFSPERLLAWARLVTGNSALASIESPSDRELINDSLTQWLAAWNSASVAREIDSLPDESLNTRLWRLATNVRRSLGAMAEIISDPKRGERRLDDCLQNIAELFADSESEFEARKSDLRELTAMIADARERLARREYLALADITDDPEIESFRTELLRVELCLRGSENDAAAWPAFKVAYAEHYIRAHREIGSSKHADAARAMLASGPVDMFECVSELPWFASGKRQAVRDLIRLARQPGCQAALDEQLDVKPFCQCGFRLGTPVGSADVLHSALHDALRAFADELAASRDQILNIVPDAGDLETLLDRITAETATVGYSPLSPADLRSLRRAADVYSAASINAPSPRWPGPAASDEVLTLG